MSAPIASSRAISSQGQYPSGILALALWVAGVPAAHGHTYLLDSQPAVGKSYAAAPQRFVLHFQSPVESRFSHYVLVRQGISTPLKPDHPSSNSNDSISGPLPSLKAGVYQLRWSVMARDGHRQEGTISFSVK